MSLKAYLDTYDNSGHGIWKFWLKSVIIILDNKVRLGLTKLRIIAVDAEHMNEIPG